MKTYPFLRSLVGILLGLTLLTSCAPATGTGQLSSKEEHKRRQEWEKDQAERARKRFKTQLEWEKDPLGAGRARDQ